MNEIARRLAEVCARIAAAAARAGRDAESIRLVGASKLQPLAALSAAYDAGLRCFGENRVQEGAGKAAALPADIEWHLLGPLQTNKVRAALGTFTLLHAVDRERLAGALETEAGARDLRVRALLEINLAGEPSKHGFALDGLAEAIAPLARLDHVDFVGLMAIPPPAATPEQARPWFRRLAQLRAELDQRPEWHGRLRELSMGMSDDFEVAIEEGATFVRVGTLLFGARAPS